MTVDSGDGVEVGGGGMVTLGWGVLVGVGVLVGDGVGSAVGRGDGLAGEVVSVDVGEAGSDDAKVDVGDGLIAVAGVTV